MSLQTVAENILGRKLHKEEGVDSMIIQQQAEACGVILPAPLQEFYTLLGRLPLFVDGYQHFFKVEQLLINDGKLVFLSENQWIVHWAVDIADGKTIYQTTDQDLKVPAIWYQEELELGDFLKMMLFFQCVMAGDALHNRTEGGYEFIASLEAEAYHKNAKAMHFITSVKQNFVSIVEGNGIAIFWQQSTHTVLLYFTNVQGIPEGMLLVCTKNETLFDQLIDVYGFTQL